MGLSALGRGPAVGHRRVVSGGSGAGQSSCVGAPNVHLAVKQRHLGWAVVITQGLRDVVETGYLFGGEADINRG